jgi:starvation-inducible DNA-binding protein
MDLQLKGKTATVTARHPRNRIGDCARDEYQHLARSLRSTHEICEKHDDVATASLVENWLDETERRTWFLSETVHHL